MASKTTNYGLNKHSPQDFYNVEARNENWDKIDEALAATDPAKVTAKAAPADDDGVMIADSADGGKAKRLLWSNVKAALGKLFVPLARKINGKALTEDVTLTAADIKMPDSEEDVGAAMAKRPLKQYPKTLDVHKITIGQLYWCDEDTANTPYKAGLTGYAQGVALCTAGSAEEKWCSIIYIVHAGKGVWFQSRNQDGWTNWVQLAKCETPEIHELPLADSINRLGTAAYWKNAFNEVTVVFDYGEKSNDNFIPDQWTLIATLPEGFRPVLQSQWGMCSDSGSDNVVATYRLDYDGSLYYRASTAAVNKKSLGGIRFVFIARN
jgi:hypothetical protein